MAGQKTAGQNLWRIGTSFRELVLRLRLPSDGLLTAACSAFDGRLPKPGILEQLSTGVSWGPAARAPQSATQKEQVHD